MTSKEELMNRILLLEPDLTQALLELISDYETKMIKLEKQDKILEILKPRIYIEEGLFHEDFQDDRLKFEKTFFESVEQENIIKEWLENDKL